MVDLHCHILPGLDDGPVTLEESLAMAQAAAKEGIRILYATPHHLRAPYENGREKVVEAVARLNETLREAAIPVEIRFGQEARVCSEFVREAWENRLLPLEGTSAVLVELPSFGIPPEWDDVLHELALLGLTPILAHPERNRAIAEDPELLRPYVDAGLLCQITSHSLTGELGARPEAAALSLCGMGLAHFIASDAHDSVKRPYKLKAAFDKIEGRYGDTMARRMEDNARRLAAGERIDSRQPAVKPVPAVKLFGWLGRKGS
ncbi:tyrosine-protein phosphatase [Cohnella soli]|uniref:Tyrosine-protein phosphatase n=1 Tax=Cohnella soli TaxID=425005 RepID=A0ABW0HKQ2_9BACL